MRKNNGITNIRFMSRRDRYRDRYFKDSCLISLNVAFVVVFPFEILKFTDAKTDHL